MSDDNIKNIIIDALPNSERLVDIVHALYARGENQLIALRDIIEMRKHQDDTHGPAEKRPDMLQANWLKLIFAEMVDGDEFRVKMVKIGAIALAAIEAHDGRSQTGDQTPGV